MKYLQQLKHVHLLDGCVRCNVTRHHSEIFKIIKHKKKKNNKHSRINILESNWPIFPEEITSALKLLISSIICLVQYRQGEGE